jgi:HEPN domain-containing protein
MTLAAELQLKAIVIRAGREPLETHQRRYAY